MVFNKPDNFYWALFFSQSLEQLKIMEAQEKKAFVDQAKKVKFKVLKLEDFAKAGSEVCTGALLEGYLINNRVYFTDCENYMWIFYVGDTCEILNQ